MRRQHQPHNKCRMKTYSIGRDVGCDIVIDDRTDVVSRRHALLNVSSWGKMTIIDQSTNGTYINGIKISSNVPVPVTRKDSVSFAHVAKLNWEQVPVGHGVVYYSLLGLIAIVIVVGIVFGLHALQKRGSVDNQPQESVEAVDSSAVKNAEQIKADSLSQAAREDSIRKAAIGEERKRQEQKRQQERREAEREKTKKDDKSAETQVTEESDSVASDVRDIG